MKFAIISCALIFGLVHGIPPTEFENVEQVQGIIETIINNTLIKIIGKLSDPVVVSDVNLNFTNSEALDGTAELSDIKVFGLKNLVASYIKIDGLTKLTMTLALPELSLSFKYGVDVVLADLIPLYGRGLNNIDIENINLNVTGEVDISKGLKVKNIGVLLTLGNAVFNLNGLLDDPEFTALVNGVLNDNFVIFVNDNNELLSGILGQLFENIINGATSLASDNYYKE